MSHISNGETFTVGELREVLKGLHEDTPVRVNLGRISGAPINASSFGMWIFKPDRTSEKVDGYLDLMVDASWTEGL